MQQTSALYKAQRLQPVALPCRMRVTFGLVDPEAAGACTAREASPQAPFSVPESILPETGTSAGTYATFEPGRMHADGSQRVLPCGAHQRIYTEGFVSAALSGADGSFAAGEIPFLTLEFSRICTAPGLSLTFDAGAGDYPAAVQITAHRQGKQIFYREIFPEGPVFILREIIERFDALTMRFVRMNRPYRRLRLGRLIFGYGIQFDEHQIIRAQQSSEIDPVMRRLPRGSFSFTAVNRNPLTGTGEEVLCDPEDPHGLYRSISERSPMTVEYGQVLADGSTEWLPAGRYYLTGRPDAQGIGVRFEGKDALGGLEDLYKKGTYLPQGRSLYRLAQDVLEDSGLHAENGVPPWHLWEGLADFTSQCPLPVKKHSELLQLIAHAACCVLYTARDGSICIEPAKSVPENYTLSRREMLQLPRVQLTPVLRGVECPVYSYVPEGTPAELCRQEITVSGRQTAWLEYPAAAEITVQVTGAKVLRKEVYAAGAELVLSGSGTAQITVTGRRLAVHRHTVRAAVNAPPENSHTERLDNPLITDDAGAQAVCEWVREWLMLRTTYECETRGDPAPDAGDLISMSGPFSPRPSPVRILKTGLSYSGGLRGKITAKRMEE